MALAHNISIVVGSFHREQADFMLETAVKTASNIGLTIAQIVRVPGSMEKPLALKRLLQESSIDGAVVLGIIERGQTAHGLVMGQAVMNAILDLQLNLMKPIGVGILGPDIRLDQIPERLETYAKSAVIAVHHMLNAQIETSIDNGL